MNNLKATTVILSGLLLTMTKASPVQIPKTTLDPSRCASTLEDQNLPHESDCAKYYRCVYGKKVPKICPEKMLFNEEIGNCDLYYNVPCSPEKIPEDDGRNEQNLEEAIERLTGTSFDVRKKIDIAVSDEDGSDVEGGAASASSERPGDTTTSRFVYMPHEEDQSAYYKIENGEKQLVRCEEGMIFSVDLEICARAWGY